MTKLLLDFCNIGERYNLLKGMNIVLLADVAFGLEGWG
jgi:hypothetical protein